ncbi:hypothetical protein J4467_03560 [Candidatus Woesearchaeota archaeon]|nr:hypothetical protein [Candidatus Woesearchaeota archaeon]
MLTWPRIAAIKTQATTKSITLAKLFKEIKDFPIKQAIKKVTNDGPQEKCRVNILNPAKMSSKPSNITIINGIGNLIIY